MDSSSKSGVAEAIGAARADMSDSTSKFGVGEAIGAASSIVALLNTLRKIISHLSDVRYGGRKSTVKLLAHQLEKTIKDHEFLSKSTELSADIEGLLTPLKKTAEELLKRVSSPKLYRVWDAIIHERFDKRIQKLQTGISVIENALKSSASRLSPNQVGPGMSQQQYHHMPAAAAAPSLAQTNITFNQPCHITINLCVGQAPGFNHGQAQGLSHGQSAYQAAPVGYPPKVFFQPAYPPTHYPSKDSV